MEGESKWRGGNGGRKKWREEEMEGGGNGGREEWMRIRWMGESTLYNLVKFSICTHFRQK
jgi:hypothetical protein